MGWALHPSCWGGPRLNSGCTWCSIWSVTHFLCELALCSLLCLAMAGANDGAVWGATKCPHNGACRLPGVRLG